MDNNNHKIYVYTNKINGKKYVGQTCKTLKKRANGNGSGYKNCIYFGRAIEKYGWENFEPKILYDNLSQEEANELEAKMIKELNTTDIRYGYNLRLGGENSPNVRLMIPIVQFDLDFNYINKYDSMKDAEFYTKTSASAISSACKHVYRQAGGYIWLFEEDYLTGNYNKEKLLDWVHEEFEHPDSKAVVQCDMQMNYLATYKNISLAAKMTKTNRTGINDNCTGRLKTCGNYIWMYEDEYNKIKDDKEKIEQIIYDVNNPIVNRHPVLQYDLNMNFISEYSSILEAHKSTKVDRKAIKYVCEGKQKSSKGYIWRYKYDKICV